MNMNDILRKKIECYVSVSKRGLESRKLLIKNCKIEKVRDVLMKYGDILEEDLKDGIYVSSMKSGVGNMNRTIIATHIDKENVYIVAFAREGLINQHTSCKAVSKIVGDLK